MRNLGYIKAAIALLQNPSQYGDAEEAAFRLIHWSSVGEFDLELTNEELTPLCRNAIQEGKNSPAQARLSIIALRLQGIIDTNGP